MDIGILIVTIVLIILVIIEITVGIIIYNKNKRNKIKSIEKLKEISNKTKKQIKNNTIIVKKKCKKPITKSKNKTNKILLIVLITIISILCVIQTCLLCTIIFSFIAYALAVPTTLLTILAICIYFKKDKPRDSN